MVEAVKRLRLKTEGRRKKVELPETDSRCLLKTTAQSSALIVRKKSIRRACDVGKMLLANE